MNVRVTPQSQVNRAIAALRQQSSALITVQNQISSGVRVAKASDDPVAFSAISAGRAADLRYDTYLQTIADSTSLLNAGVSALQEGNQVLTRARQITQQAIDSTTHGSDYESLASEVDTLIDRMMTAANTEVDGRSIFGGTNTSEPPFSAASKDAQGRPVAIAYNGSPDAARGLIGPGHTIDTRYVGNQVFQQEGANVFQTLVNLRDDLRSTTLSTTEKAEALTQRLADVQTTQNHVGNVIGAQSSSLSNLEALQGRMQDMQFDARSRVGDLQDTDYAEAIVKLTQQESLFQATLATSSRLFQTSLLDFIR